jgi:hypothetical protein
MKTGCLVLIGLVAVAVLAGSIKPEARPAAGPAQPTAAQATVAPSTPGIYYLWYKSNPSVGIAIMGPSRKAPPVDGNQLLTWVLAGSACVADAGTKAYRGNTSAPAFTVAVEVAEGVCRGFAGWVPTEAFQQTKRP